MGDAADKRRSAPWAAEFDAFARAFGGAALFGMPLIFTMEMWWIGEFQPRLHLLGFVLLALVTNIALARMSGFRPDFGDWRRDVAQAVEAMAVGVVLSVGTLAALGRITPDTSIEGLYGMASLQVIPLSVGAMVGNLVFAPKGGRTGSDDDRRRPQTPVQELVNDLAATFVGAMFLGFAIAPTEEIPMLASGMTVWNVVGVIVLSLFASYVIVFASGFDHTHRDDDQAGGIFQSPFSETMLCLLVSLVAAALLLFGFGQFTLDDPIESIIVMTIVLGVPATIGGAAGRVVV
jgi:putative integral membrane protein (TIGR02587 family)